MPEFVVLYEDKEFEINFVARASPRSRGIHLEWTKQNERGLNDDHEILLKIIRVDKNGQEYRRQNLRHRFQRLGKENYECDIGRGWSPPLDPDQRYTVKIRLKSLELDKIVAKYELRDCRCYISEEQFQNLRLKAEQFCLKECGGIKRMRKFTHFYRSDKVTDKEQKGSRKQFVLTAKQKMANQGHLVPGVEYLKAPKNDCLKCNHLTPPAKDSDFDSDEDEENELPAKWPSKALSTSESDENEEDEENMEEEEVEEEEKDGEEEDEEEENMEEEEEY